VKQDIIIKQNANIVLSKTKSILDITNKILDNSSNLPSNLNDEWMNILWRWADEWEIPDLEEIGPDTGIFWIGLPRNREELLTFKELTIYNQYFNFEKIPDEICRLKSLEVLTLSSNNLHELPEDIENLVNLRVLDISNNALETLPKGIVKLKNLQYLDLYKNDNLILTDEQKEWLLHLSQKVKKYQDKYESPNSYIDPFSNGINICDRVGIFYNIDLLDRGKK